jgi:hypothetical protein
MRGRLGMRVHIDLAVWVFDDSILINQTHGGGLKIVGWIKGKLDK